MKKTMTRNIVIMAIVTVIMAVVLSLYIKNTGTVPAADNAANLTDGTYTSSAQGCLSEVAVTVTVTGGKVTNVAIDASGETPDLCWKYLDCAARFDCRTLPGYRPQRLRMLQFACTPRRRAKAALFALSPELFRRVMNH